MLIVSNSGEVKLTRGDTAKLTVNITDDEKQPYSVQNDDVLTLTVKKDVKDTEGLIEKKITGSDTFHIEPKDTAELDFGKYKYDVQLNTADGEVYTVIPPTVFEILAEVTH